MFEALKTLVKATSLRRTKKSELKQCDLPRRYAKVQSVGLETAEKSIYDFFKKRAANIVFNIDGDDGNSKHVGNILRTITKLRQICNHSTGFLPPAMLAAAESRNETSLYDVELQQDRFDNCRSTFTEIQDIDLTEQDVSCSHSLCQTCLAWLMTKMGKLLVGAFFVPFAVILAHPLIKPVWEWQQSSANPSKPGWNLRPRSLPYSKISDKTDSHQLNSPVKGKWMPNLNL